MTICTIILAAGKGTRMRSDLPKVLHRIADKPLLRHVYDLCQQIEHNQIKIIYGYGGEQVKQTLSDINTVWIEQAQQLGTGHAVIQAKDQIADTDTVLILYGDVPLLKVITVETLLAQVTHQTLALLTVELTNPTGYGRIVRDEKGQVIKIVEEKDASVSEKQITEVNTGIMAIEGAKLKECLARLTNQNAQGEYYLTDVIELAVADGFSIASSQPQTVEEVLGVNNKAQLSQLERVYQLDQAKALMEQGISLRDPARFDLRGSLEQIGQDIEIDINVLIEGRVSLGHRVKIGANVILKNTVIADDVEILPMTIIEDAIIGQGSRVGPFARIRPETELDVNVHIGNFVEIKKTKVAAGSKINHLSYIGDAIVGSQVNIGAGTITCNYDGVNKSITVIGDGAFIGSDTQLIAPVSVGKNATIGAGSTITKDAPENQLTLSRGKQTTVPGWQRPSKKQEK